MQRQAWDCRVSGESLMICLYLYFRAQGSSREEAWEHGPSIWPILRLGNVCRLSHVDPYFKISPQRRQPQHDINPCHFSLTVVPSLRRYQRIWTGSPSHDAWLPLLFLKVYLEPGVRPEVPFATEGPLYVHIVLTWSIALNEVVQKRRSLKFPWNFLPGSIHAIL